MNTELTDELLSAALDGERVNVEALQRALERPGARETLAAFVLLRAAASADAGGVSDIAGARIQRPFMAQERVVHGHLAPAWRLLGKHFPLGIAASLAAMAVAGSFWLGTTWRSHGLEGAPSAVSRTAASPTQSDKGGATNQQGREDQPPTPTRRLQFVPGTEWQPGS